MRTKGQALKKYDEEILKPTTRRLRIKLAVTTAISGLLGGLGYWSWAWLVLALVAVQEGISALYGIAAATSALVIFAAPFRIALSHRIRYAGPPEVMQTLDGP